MQSICAYVLTILGKSESYRMNLNTLLNYPILGYSNIGYTIIFFQLPMPKTIYSKDYKLLLAKIREARLEADLTQKEVSDKLGKTQSYISKIELGERRLDIIELKVLAQIYRKNINYFIEN